LDTLLPQQRIRSDEVEIKVWNSEFSDIASPSELQLAAFLRQDNFHIILPFKRLRIQSLKIRNGLGEALLKFCKGLLVVLPYHGLSFANANSKSFGYVAVEG
jgi:hypothetical protein